jgi:hypothetical protein
VLLTLQPYGGAAKKAWCATGTQAQVAAERTATRPGIFVFGDRCSVEGGVLGRLDSSALFLFLTSARERRLRGLGDCVVVGVFRLLHWIVGILTQEVPGIATCKSEEVEEIGIPYLLMQ